MSNRDLLNEVLGMIRTIMDDQEKIKKLHQYLLDELYEEPAEEEIIIPEKYKTLIKNIAEYMSGDWVCYLNLDTLEAEPFPKSMLTEMFWDFEDEEEDDEEAEEEEDDPMYLLLKQIRRWDNKIVIEPPDSHISYSYMEDFVETLGNGRIKMMLSEALSGRKPFRNFNHIIHQVAEREDWFAFRQKRMEEYVLEELKGQLPDLQ